MSMRKLQTVHRSGKNPPMAPPRQYPTAPKNVAALSVGQDLDQTTEVTA